MNKFKMFIQLIFLRKSMITDRDLFQPFFDMNWFLMIFQIDCFRKIIVTIFFMFCDILTSWKWLACLSKMSILEKPKLQTRQLCDIIFEWTDSRCFYKPLFLEKAWSQIEIFFNFFYMYWFSMIFQTDFFRKIIATILSCCVTYCPHKNDWHVFLKCLF